MPRTASLTRIGTILRRQVRPIRDTDRFSLTPAGMAALDAASRAHDSAVTKDAETAQGANSAVKQASDDLIDTRKDTNHANH